MAVLASDREFLQAALPPMASRVLVDIKVAATYLGVHPRTVRNLVTRGELIAHRVGEHGHLRFDLADVDAVVRPVLVGSA